MEKSKFLEAGEIVGTHGVRGEVKILPWTDSVDFLRRFKTLYINEKPYTVKSSFAHKGCMIALLDGVEDLNAAMALKGRTVCFARADARLPKGRFFLADLMGAKVVTEDGALVDLSRRLGGWVSVIGYIFTLLALATSFWANTLNLRDIIHEQTDWNLKLSWLAATAPCLVLALLGLSSFVGFSRFASLIQVVTGVGIIWAYHLSRKRVGTARLVGPFGSLAFQIIVVLCTLLATVGAVLPVS